MKNKDIMIIGGLVALAAAAYYGLKNINLKDILSGIGGGILQAGGAAPETLKETGAAGGIGDIIYNFTMGEGGGDLRQRSQEAAALQKIPFSKSVAQTVAADIHKGGVWSFLNPLQAPITIGSGLGAITQWNRYLSTLSPQERKQEEKIESIKRLKFQTTPEGIAASALMPPVVSIPLAVSDYMKATQKIEQKKPIPAPQKTLEASTIIKLQKAKIPPSLRLQLARLAFKQ